MNGEIGNLQGKVAELENENALLNQKLKEKIHALSDKLQLQEEIHGLNDKFQEKIHGLEKEKNTLSEKITRFKIVTVISATIFLACLLVFWGIEKKQIAHRVLGKIEEDLLGEIVDTAETYRDKTKLYNDQAKEHADEIQGYTIKMQEYEKKIENIRIEYEKELKKIDGLMSKKVEKAEEGIKAIQTEYEDGLQRIDGLISWSNRLRNNRSARGEEVEIIGGSPNVDQWVWANCPDGRYVCGVSPGFGRIQTGIGSVESTNSLKIKCCPF